jgi:replication factor C small subunit
MEDLRPSTLDTVVGQVESIGRLRRFAEGARSGRIVPTHLLFHGPPGVGKTTAARAFAHEVLGADWDNSFHELRAYDARGVDRIRDDVVELARRPPSRKAPFRIVFFDEADELEPEVQNVLRPALESDSGSTVFILACNTLERVSAPIRSRCTVLEFTALTPEEMRRVVLESSRRAGLALDEALAESILRRANGIPREAVKLVIEEFGDPARTAPHRRSGRRRTPTGAPADD